MEHPQTEETAPSPLKWWASGPHPGAPSPWRDILGEHELAALVLKAMEEETRRLYDRSIMRADFWLRIADFAGRFMESFHRRKEEEVMFPALASVGDEGDREVVKKFSKDHARAHALTSDLCAGVEEGDWERVLRCSMIYVSGMRKHMSKELEALGHLAAKTPDPGVLADLSRRCADIEHEALGGEGRAHFLGVVRDLCEETDVEFPLP